jgi:hypothetical protein
MTQSIKKTLFSHPKITKEGIVAHKTIITNMNRILGILALRKMENIATFLL